MEMNSGQLSLPEFIQGVYKDSSNFLSSYKPLSNKFYYFCNSFDVHGENLNIIIDKLFYCKHLMI